MDKDVSANKAMCDKATVGQLNAMAIKIPTVGENIERQIEHHKAVIMRLEAIRSKLEKANLLSINISDLREAMGY